jgi:GAF domain
MTGGIVARFLGASAGCAAMKTRRRKTTKLKRRKMPTATRRRGLSAADLQEKLDRQASELSEARAEALEQQTATSEVLRVISSSPGELQPVFQAMLENAVRICGAKFGALWLFDGTKFRAGALHNVPAAFVEFWQRGPHSPTPSSALGRVAATKRTVQIADLKAEEGYARGDPLVIAGVELAVIRSFVVVPMLKVGELIGAIGIYQQQGPAVQ